MSIKSKIAKLGAAATVATALTVLGTGAAFAGTNGQQIELYDGKGNTYSVDIWGYNQNGAYVDHCFQTPATDNYINGWWWIGYTDMAGYDDSTCGNSGGHLTFTASVNVPQVQSGSDYTYVNDATA